MTTRIRRTDILRFLFDPRLRRDPYPLYERLRRSSPVYTSIAAATLVADHENVMAALRDPRLSNRESTADLGYGAGRAGAGLVAEAPFRFLIHRSSSRGTPGSFVQIARRFLLSLDAPDHTRLRGLVARAFTPRTVAAASPTIEKIANELIDGFEHRSEVDLIAEYAYQVPVRVICELLGVPTEDYPRFHQWVAPLVRRFDVSAIGSKAVAREGDRAADAMREYVLRLAAERRAEPRDDLISVLVATADDGDRLDQDELVSVVLLLLVAGHETTANLIGNGTWHLHRHPDQLDRWRDEPAIHRSGVEELLRYDSPIQLAQRITTEAVDYGGVAIAPRRLVILLLGSANRDPHRFPDPDRLDLGRPDNHHASFGFGTHHCIGASLARAEGAIALRVLHDRLPRLRPAVEEPAWRTSIVFRGLQSLPVRWG